MDTEFLEIEHKFVLTDCQSKSAMLSKLASLEAPQTTEISVQDRYYVLNGVRDRVFRHRLDSEIQQLTMKSFGKSPEVRSEVNIHLGLSRGDQSAAIGAFLAGFGEFATIEIQKKVWVYYFKTVEIVYYEASCEDRAVRCLEIEARAPKSVDQGLAEIEKYENKIGFAGAAASTQSLLELVGPEWLLQKLSRL